MDIKLVIETVCLVKEAIDDGLADQASDLNSGELLMAARPLEAAQIITALGLDK